MFHFKWKSNTTTTFKKHICFGSRTSSSSGKLPKWSPEYHLVKASTSVTHEDGMWLPPWLDWKTVTCAIISPKIVNPRDKSGNAEEEELSEYTWYSLSTKGLRISITVSRGLRFRLAIWLWLCTPRNKCSTVNPLSIKKRKEKRKENENEKCSDEQDVYKLTGCKFGNGI